MQRTLSLVSPLDIGCFRLPAQLVLHRGDLYQVPAYYRLLRIKAGMAYVTQTDHDRILPVGQEWQLDRATDIALVSSIGCEPVVLELFTSQNCNNQAAPS
jgi:hypothetical protein